MFYTVPQGHVALVERWGKFDRTLTAGLNVLNPFTESVKKLDTWGRVANKEGCYIELTEQQTNTSVRHCQTKDNVTIKANTSISWRIIDPVKAAYEVDILPSTIADIALNALRSNIGTMQFDEILSSRVLLNENILNELSSTVDKWGVKLIRVELQELTYSDVTAKAMMKEMIAEREKRAVITEAEGSALAEVMRAESKATALIIETEANTRALKMVAESESLYLQTLALQVGIENATEILKAEKSRRSMEKISENPGNKIFLPVNTSTIIVAA